MSTPITFTLDLEDHRPNDAAALRYPAMTRQILGRLHDLEVTGTFFVVGSIGAAQPDLVREIAAAGHEIALHGWNHVPLVDHDPASFRADVTRGKAFLEDLIGEAVVGYRAPTFSLVASTTWAPAVLTEAGFTYSSSVLPTRNPLYGYPGAPTDPFLWPCGLAEFPVPIVSGGPVGLPYLGGTYLRLLPGPAITAITRRAGRRVPWTYMHPYDIDRDEPYWQVPDAGRLSPLLWVGRRSMTAKLDRLLGAGDRSVAGGDADPEIAGAPAGRRGSGDCRSLVRSGFGRGTGAGSTPHATGAGPPLRDRLAEARAGGTFHPGTGTVTDAEEPNQEKTETMGEFTQGTMVHVLPPAPLVDRIDYLVGLAKGRSVTHVGFVDTGCQTMNQQAGAWLHGHLHQVATSLIGVDIDEAGVKEATAAGYEAYAADCRDVDSLRELAIAPAELVIAGEVIEHLDDPGAFLAGLQTLVAPGGTLVVTTPNAYGLFNVLASLARREINHPDHVVMFTWRTLTNLASRHGWEPIETRVYVPSVKDLSGRGITARALDLAARFAVTLERSLAKVGRGYAADGLIIVFRSTR